MLVVRVEVWPGGNPLWPKPVATLGLANVSGLADTSAYEVVEIGSDGARVDAQVEGHLRSAGWRPLVSEALDQLGSHPLAENRHEKVARLLTEFGGRRLG